MRAKLKKSFSLGTWRKVVKIMESKDLERLKQISSEREKLNKKIIEAELDINQATKKLMERKKIQKWSKEHLAKLDVEAAEIKIRLRAKKLEEEQG